MNSGKRRWDLSVGTQSNGAKIPDPDEAGEYEDLRTSDGLAVFFLAVDEYYFSSIHDNWRFLNLNAAYSYMIAITDENTFGVQ